MTTQYERAKAKAFKVVTFFVAMGKSWKGRTTKRDGKAVMCPHKHKTSAAAEMCARKMRQSRPGNCQTYRVAQIEMLCIKRGRDDS